MILIPLGHENDATRRVPWVTFGLLAACVLVFFLTGRGGQADAWESVERTERAVEYYMEHPYLTLREDAEQELFGGDAEDRETIREGLRGGT